jgi:hypothetical protein
MFSSIGHPWILGIAAVIGIILLLPSWTALVRTLRSSSEPEWWKPFIPSANWASYPFQQRWDQAYTKQTVKLDGYDYIRCTFDNVTFHYNGTAPFSFRDCTFIQQPPAILSTENNVVAQALSLAAVTHQVMGGKTEINFRSR